MTQPRNQIRRFRRREALFALLFVLLISIAGCSGDSKSGAVEADSGGGVVTSGTIAGGDEALSAPQTSLPAPETTTGVVDPVESRLAAMDTRAKAAQLLVIGFAGTTPPPELLNLLHTTPPAGVILFERNIVGPQQLADLTAELQSAAAESGEGVSLLIAVDQEGGTVRRVHEGVPQTPGARTIAGTMSADEAKASAREVAEALLRLGVNVNLSPVADVVSDPASFLYERSFAGDPATVAAYVRAVIAGQEEAGVISAAKHFPGHGSATGDTHEGRVASHADLDELAAHHLGPFEAAIEGGVPMIMMSHLVAAGLGDVVPASVSPGLIEGLLRDDLGFEGVVITDDMMMAGSSGAGEAALEAVRAGADIVLIGRQAREQWLALDSLVAAVEGEQLSPERLDEAVTRVLRLKQRYGLLEP